MLKNTPFSLCIHSFRIPHIFYPSLYSIFLANSIPYPSFLLAFPRIREIIFSNLSPFPYHRFCCLSIYLFVFLQTNCWNCILKQISAVFFHILSDSSRTVYTSCYTTETGKNVWFEFIENWSPQILCTRTHYAGWVNLSKLHNKFRWKAFFNIVTIILSNMVVFRLSPCLECSLCSFGNFPGVWSIKVDVSELNVGSIVLGDQE